MSTAEVRKYRHMPTVYFRRRLADLFRRSYWVGCWDCDMRLGPYPVGFAHFVSADLDGGMGDRRPECAHRV